MTFIVNPVYLCERKCSQLGLLSKYFKTEDDDISSTHSQPYGRPPHNSSFIIKKSMATTKPNPIKKYAPRIIIGIIVLSGAIYGFRAYQYNQTIESTDNAQIDGNTAPVLARVAGYVKELSVTDYQQVKAGQPLVEIDPAEYDLAVSQAEADYAQSVADLQTARASMLNSRESVKVARANVDVQAGRQTKAQSDLQRDQNLFTGGSLTKRSLEDSKSTTDIQSRQLTALQAQATQAKVAENTSEANIRKMEAVLKVKQAAIDQAKLRNSYTQITAPIDGKTGRTNNVSVGQYVQPGQTLFTIVNGTDLWVTANFKETQLTNIRVGQPVEIKVDAFPDMKIEGKVAEISEATGAKFSLLPPDNASGNFVKVTQRIPVKIQIENVAQLKDRLRVGMSVEAVVKLN